MIRRLLAVATVVVVVAVGALISEAQVGSGDRVDPGTGGTTTVVAAPTTTPIPPVATSSTTTEPPRPLPVPEQPGPPPPLPEPGLPDGFRGTGAVVVAAGGAEMAERPGGEPFVRARQGLVLAGEGFSPDRRRLRVFHMCDGRAWVSLDEIAAVLPAGDTPPAGAGFDFADAVLVVDPGHGGPNIGAQSPDGLVEKRVNMDIAARLRDLLTVPHTIDWATGEILIGDAIPAARSVVVTRSGAGGAADYEAGLDFRAAVADALDAHAMVSIHNNAGWERETRGVGSEAYYQSQEPVTEESRRLAVLVVEELRRGFAPFQADWVGSRDLGAKSRLSPGDGTSQYYGLLRSSPVPTVIVEGVYIANPSEADLLRTAEFRQAYAEAVYRALVRFLTTGERGSAPVHRPVVWEGLTGRGGAGDDCTIPRQLDG